MTTRGRLKASEKSRTWTAVSPDFKNHQYGWASLRQCSLQKIYRVINSMNKFDLRENCCERTVIHTRFSFMLSVKGAYVVQSLVTHQLSFVLQLLISWAREWRSPYNADPVSLIFFDAPLPMDCPKYMILPFNSPLSRFPLNRIHPLSWRSSQSDQWPCYPFRLMLSFDWFVEGRKKF